MNWKLYYAIAISLWLLGLAAIAVVVALGHFEEWPYYTALGIDTLLFGAVIAPTVIRALDPDS